MEVDTPAAQVVPQALPVAQAAQAVPQAAPAPQELTDGAVQQFVLDTTKKHAILDAVAGAGKSYRLGEALQCMPEDVKVCTCSVPLRRLIGV